MLSDFTAGVLPHVGLCRWAQKNLRIAQITFPLTDGGGEGLARLPHCHLRGLGTWAEQASASDKAIGAESRDKERGMGQRNV